jgi:SAM-dependent methyltransferase
VRPQFLMLGSGHKAPARRIIAPGPPLQAEPQWTTLDINPECKPDKVFDLNTIDAGGLLPFPSNTFDEIHAYQTMEHFGKQGNFIGFFNAFRAIWHALKPGGLFVGESPSITSMWLWGDPGHTRVICGGSIVYLTRELYANGLGTTTATDYRKFVDPYWWVIEHSVDRDGNFEFVLRKAN